MSEEQLKALIIRDDRGKFRDLEDVLKIARVQGKIIFGTRQEIIRVLKILGPFPEIGGYVVVVSAGKPAKRKVVNQFPGVGRREQTEK